jgi:CRP-like cAMP-binding protein
MTRPLERFVHRLELRSRLSPAEKAALLAIDAERIVRQARWDLVRPGEKVAHACLVDKGMVARSETFADGRRQTSAVFIAGDMADLHSVPVPVAAWALTALTDSEVYHVPHEAIRRVAREFPRVAEALWRDTVADASAASKWVAVLSRHPARKRLAHLLCEFGVRYAAAGLGRETAFELNLTQDQLSEILGTTTVHVYRTFKELRSEGVIATERRAVRILDGAALARIAEFDPAYLLLHPSP